MKEIGQSRTAVPPEFLRHHLGRDMFLRENFYDFEKLARDAYRECGRGAVVVFIESIAEADVRAILRTPRATRSFRPICQIGRWCWTR